MAARYLVGNNLNNVIRGGDASDDTIYGLDGDDTLYGGSFSDSLFGGYGNDILYGGAHFDIFYFTTTPGPGNVDAIMDYSVADDGIRLDDAIYTALPAGGLSADAFFVGTAAQDASDRIIYDSSTGALYYDPDGTGAADQVQFATLVGITGTLVNTEFCIY